jgi:GxxExxY protein
MGSILHRAAGDQLPGRQQIAVEVVDRLILEVAVAEEVLHPAVLVVVVIVELKAVASLDPTHTAQLLTYLKLAGRRVGLLINFNVPVLKDGIRRFKL